MNNLINNRNIETLTKWYFSAAREAAMEDIVTTSIMYGLPEEFLEKLVSTSIAEMEEITSNIKVLPFQPRVNPLLLMKLLDSPSEAGSSISDTLIVQGMSKNASPIS